MVMYAIQLVTIVLLRTRLMRLNVLKRRAQGLRESKAAGDESKTETEVSAKNAFSDMTDRENPDCKPLFLRLKL